MGRSTVLGTIKWLYTLRFLHVSSFESRRKIHGFVHQDLQTLETCDIYTCKEDSPVYIPFTNHFCHILASDKSWLQVVVITMASFDSTRNVLEEVYDNICTGDLPILEDTFDPTSFEGMSVDRHDAHWTSCYDYFKHFHDLDAKFLVAFPRLAYHSGSCFYRSDSSSSDSSSSDLSGLGLGVGDTYEFRDGSIQICGFINPVPVQSITHNSGIPSTVRCQSTAGADDNSCDVEEYDERSYCSEDCNVESEDSESEGGKFKDNEAEYEFIESVDIESEDTEYQCGQSEGSQSESSQSESSSSVEESADLSE